MQRHWFITIDTERLRGTLSGHAAAAVRAAVARAAASVGLRLPAAVVISCGVRAVIAGGSLDQVRAYWRRLIGFAASAPIRWRRTCRIQRLRRDDVVAALARIRAMAAASEEVLMIQSSSRTRAAVSARKLPTLLREIERAVDAVLGADEAAVRIRRYVADHDAPADDRQAFERLCAVIFAQGIGFETVAAKAEALRAAFAGFDPAAVAAFSPSAEGALRQAPIIRNPAKIAACVENARRWTAAAQAQGTYLARVAQTAAADDAPGGWPALAQAMADGFVRLGDTASRQVLKRWGFFTTLAHPGARRVLVRLGIVGEPDGDPVVQRVIGKVAERLGRDAYAVEAVLALFAGIGPCKKAPACTSCVLSDRCPSSTA